MKEVFIVCVILTGIFTSSRMTLFNDAWCQTKSKIEGKRTGGIIGDPSRKRGFDLGYDAGPRAGREDQAQNKKAAPSLRFEYKKPEQFYRYEYGSRALFISGYRRGFLLGYKSAFLKQDLTPRAKKWKTQESIQSIVVLKNDLP